MSCVTKINCKIKVNGMLGDNFSRKRGLRQGNSLSHYLSIMAVEVFSVMLTKANQDNILLVIKLARPLHPFFTDDF